jgi:hypothetical protein
MRLVDLAHARSGDKGDIADITVVARDPGTYAHLRALITAEAVAAHFADLAPSTVERFELPRLHALKFVLHDALDGGVTRSLRLDVHGKCLSSCLLEMDVPDV